MVVCLRTVVRHTQNKMPWHDPKSPTAVIAVAVDYPWVTNMTMAWITMAACCLSGPKMTRYCEYCPSMPDAPTRARWFRRYSIRSRDWCESPMK